MCQSVLSYLGRCLQASINTSTLFKRVQSYFQQDCSQSDGTMSLTVLGNKARSAGKQDSLEPRSVEGPTQEQSHDTSNEETYQDDCHYSDNGIIQDIDLYDEKVADFDPVIDLEAQSDDDDDEQNYNTRHKDGGVSVLDPLRITANGSASDGQDVSIINALATLAAAIGEGEKLFWPGNGMEAASQTFPLFEMGYRNDMYLPVEYHSTGRATMWRDLNRLILAVEISGDEIRPIIEFSWTLNEHDTWVIERRDTFEYFESGLSWADKFVSQKLLAAARAHFEHPTPHLWSLFYR